MNENKSKPIDKITMFMNGGFRRDYTGVYLNNDLIWSDKDCDIELILFTLLKKYGNGKSLFKFKEVVVPDEIADRMGLGGQYPKSLKVWQTIITSGVFNI